MMSALLRVCCSVYILSTTAFGNMDTLQSSAAATPALPTPGFGSATFDSSLTDQARIYAGMMPLNPLHYSNLTSTKAWQQHRKIFEENWAKLNKRLLAMSVWRDPPWRVFQ